MSTYTTIYNTDRPLKVVQTRALVATLGAKPTPYCKLSKKSGLKEFVFDLLEESPTTDDLLREAA